MKYTKFINPPALFLAVVFTCLSSVTFGAVNPTLVSRAPNGDNGNSDARIVNTSADGRYVVFDSRATNLVAGVTENNSGQDVFFSDTQTGVIRCVSCVGTATGNNESSNPIISADGRYVVFVTVATDLVGGIDINNSADVIRWDSATNQRELVSIVPFGAATGDAGSGTTTFGRGYDISDDGRYVVFFSLASNLTNFGDTNNVGDIFLRDMQGGLTSLISRNRFGSIANNRSVDPSISADGQTIAFASLATDIVASDGNNNYDVFVYNAQTGTQCASVVAAGTGATGSSFSASAQITKDGSRVSYYSISQDLTNTIFPIDTPMQLYVRDLGLGLNLLVSVNMAGNGPANATISSGGAFENLNGSNISANGRYVTFETRASNLTAVPTNSSINIFRRDLGTGRTELVTVNSSGTGSGTQNSFAGTRGRGMSRDGRFVIFTGVNSNMVSDYPAAAVGALYVRDMLGGVTTLLTLNNAGTAGSTGGIGFSVISTNGKSVVFTSVASDLTQTNVNNAFNVFRANVPTPQKAVSDFNGDGLTDYSVFRPGQGAWYVLNSDATFASYRLFGAATDTIVPADYSGDGRTDYGVFRPSNANWYISDGLTFAETIINFGLAGDKPMPQDYDGDGKADLGIYRPSTGTWWYRSSINGAQLAIQFGISTDIPVPGDFDGDGRADLAVFRPSEGNWYIRRSQNGSATIVHFGSTGDKPVAADYDGDGKSDIAVYRAGVWYVLQSITNSISITTFGVASDVPSVGSYDTDGRADIAVWRPSDGNWYVLRSSTQSLSALHFGQIGDQSVPAAFIQ